MFHKVYCGWQSHIFVCADAKMWNASRFCVSSLRRGHANLLCIVPILTDDLRGESKCVKNTFGMAHRPGPHIPQPSCNCRQHPIGTGSLANKCKKLVSLLDLCVSSLRRGHAKILCIVPILTDDPRKESKVTKSPGFQDLHTHRWVSALAHAGK